ncbi:phage head morphogenesis protein, SPP1 gp7 family [Bacteroidales bacterium Barb6]|nr:phage head morphogenesis protein, SPP1 gp7 family [Bacteroidales bacterium Barb6]
MPKKTFFSPDWTIKDNNMLNRVQNNLLAFSGAKSYSEAKELRDAVYEEGKLLPKDEFLARARQINREYNAICLDVERQFVMASGTQASRWTDIEESADTHPWLEYMTKKDSHVRTTHRLLQGIILPVDDPFRNSCYPPNGWRCHCSTRKPIQRMYDSRMEVYEQKRTSNLADSEMSQRRAGEAVAKPFRRNVGTSEIFDRNGHPCFKANKDAKEMQLSAVKNYGMKPVKDIYDQKISLSKYKGGFKSPEEFREQRKAWEKQSGKPEKGSKRKPKVSFIFQTE